VSRSNINFKIDFNAYNADPRKGTYNNSMISLI